jgi:hypothetical protein
MWTCATWRIWWRYRATTQSLSARRSQSAFAGVHGSPDYLIRSNLLGAYNCLEFALRRHPFFLFVSTSRVSPVAALVLLVLEDTASRFEISEQQEVFGASSAAIGEGFTARGRLHAMRFAKRLRRQPQRRLRAGSRLTGVQSLVHLRYASLSPSPDPGHLAVLTRPGFVGAASTRLFISGVRPPPASPNGCDSPGGDRQPTRSNGASWRTRGSGKRG